MYQEFIAAAEQFVSPGERVVLAISGGADSMCLAHLFGRWSKEGGPPIHIAHVNHQLRGKESDEDATFVSRWADDWGLPCTVVDIEISKKQGQSIQDVARRHRYQALLDICLQAGAVKLATAHHADDQVETFLLNLLRGSGSRGLRGIPERRPLGNGVAVFRPLLGFTRQRIEDYCRTHNVAWREDRTNLETEYMRNRVRHQLLPAMRELNPAIERAVLKAVEIVERDQCYLEKLEQQAYEKVLIKSPLPFAPLCLSLDGLMNLDPALRYRVVARALGREAESRHVDAVLGLADSETGSSLDVPGGKAYRLDTALAFGSEPPSPLPVNERVVVPGRLEIPAMGVRVETDWQCLPEGHGFWLPSGVEELQVTRRHKGDVISLPGGSKKLKDYLIDKKIPRWLRDDFPVIRCQGEIVWVVGLVKSQRFLQPGDNCRKVYVKISVGEEKGNA